MPTDETQVTNLPAQTFDSYFYATLYPDLIAAGLSSESKLRHHYERSGIREERVPNHYAFAAQFGIPSHALKQGLSWLEILRANGYDETVGDSYTLLSETLPPLSKDGSPKQHRRERSIDTITVLVSFLYPNGQEALTRDIFNQSIQTLKSLAAEDQDRTRTLCETIGYDDTFYEEANKDLAINGVTTAEGRLSHFIQNGVKEERCYNVPTWLKRHKLPAGLLGGPDSLKFAIERTAKLGNPFSSVNDALETLRGRHNAGRVWFSEKAEDNAVLYVTAGKALLQHDPSDEDKQHAKNLFQIACTFDGNNAEALFQIGNLHAERTERKEAVGFFERALECGGDPAKIIPHLIWMHRALQNIDAAFDTFVTYLPLLRGKADMMAQISDFCQEIWDAAEKQGAAGVFETNRDTLIENTVQAAERQHRLWMLAAGTDGDLPQLGAIRTDRVLIVGDRFLQQCDRYRIKQKVEQLEAVGLTVTATSWVEIQHQMSELSFYDVVIFYRVPALPQVIKAIAQVNATGRLAIYEIDDLIFDPIYPPALDTYGGAVSIAQYAGLAKGMALFQAAARLCRIGIASTEPLRTRLAQLVTEKRCLLHRNGLDSLLSEPVSPNSTTSGDEINLFYGSGTLAHNNDFCDLALPAIEEIMTQDDRVQLIIAGYLQLPKWFSEKLSDQIIRFPPTKDIAIYYRYLQMADINLATLIPDEITDCKSELKWFEAAYLNIPSVVSDTRNYLDVIDDGETGLIARNAKEWSHCLSTLVKDGDLRAKIAQNAQKFILDEYSVEILGARLKNSIDQEVQNLNPETSPKPKIALVNVYYDPQSIGGATRVFEGNISAYREEHGDNLDFVVFSSGMGEDTPHEVTVDSKDGMRVYRSNVIFRENMDWMPKDPEMGEVFKRFLEVERPDIVHFHCIQRLTGSIVEATRDMGIPYIVTLHDAWWFSDLQFLVDSDGKVYPEGHPGMRAITETHPPANTSKEDALARRFYLRSLLETATSVITVSESFANVCRTNGFPETGVCVNGVDSTVQWQKKDASHSERVVCGQIGSMSSHKGYTLLRDTVMALQPLNLEFLIVDHSKGPDWEKKDAWGNVPVTFIGRQRQNDIAALYSRMDVLMAPSIWPESFGLVTREAAVSGCWVVASDLGGIGEDVEHGVNGFVISPDEASLGEVIQQLDTDPQRYKALAPIRQSRTDREQAEEMITLYRGILSKMDLK